MRIFGLGTQKTGNTSIASALEQMGFAVRQWHRWAHHQGRSFLAHGDLAIVKYRSRTWNAWIDYPIMLYRELDEAYPRAFWIHNVRDTESWLPSLGQQLWRHYNHRKEGQRDRMASYYKRVFGAPWPTPKQAAEAKERTERELNDWLKDRTHIRLNIFTQPDWTQRLADFLSTRWRYGKPPRENVTNYHPIPEEEMRGTALEAWIPVLNTKSAGSGSTTTTTGRGT